MNILHAFQNYLFNTENWAYNIIKNLPDVQNFITSENYISENFYPSDFKFIKFPIAYFPPNSIQNPLLDKFIYYTSNAGRKWGYIPYLASQLKDQRIDLIHSHMGPSGFRHLPLAKKLNIPHVVSFYGHDYEQIRNLDTRWEKRYQQLFEEADIFLAEGEYAATVFEKIGCPSSKIRVAKLGVEVDQIPFFERKKEKNSLNLLQVSRFTETKGHQYLINAISKLRTIENLHLTFVGRGELKDQIVEMVRLHQLENKISFIDSIPISKLHSFMKDFDVFIHPSCYAKDGNSEGGAPIVLLDAQATGMPIISTTHCDIPSEVIHQKTGLLSAEKDIQGLSQSIIYFYEMDNFKYQKFSQKARQHVTQNYNVIENARVLKQIYESVLI